MLTALKKWPANDFFSTLFGVAIFLSLNSVLNGLVSPSAAIAGSFAALVMRYLHQCGYSIVDAVWRVRLVLLATFIGAVVLGGFVAMLLGFE